MKVIICITSSKTFLSETVFFFLIGYIKKEYSNYYSLVPLPWLCSGVIRFTQHCFAPSLQMSTQ